MLGMWQWDPSKKNRKWDSRSFLWWHSASSLGPNRVSALQSVKPTLDVRMHTHTNRDRHTFLNCIRSPIEPFKSATAIFLKASIFLSLKKATVENKLIAQKHRMHPSQPEPFQHQITGCECVCVLFVIYNWMRNCVWLHNRAKQGGNM